MSESMGKMTRALYTDAARAQPKHNDVTLEHCGVEASTDLAVKVVLSEGDEGIWIPKSQIVDIDNEGLVLTHWWARSRGLV